MAGLPPFLGSILCSSKRTSCLQGPLGMLNATIYCAETIEIICKFRDYFIWVWVFTGPFVLVLGKRQEPQQRTAAVLNLISLPFLFRKHIQQRQSVVWQMWHTWLQWGAALGDEWRGGVIVKGCPGVSCVLMDRGWIWVLIERCWGYFASNL